MHSERAPVRCATLRVANSKGMKEVVVIPGADIAGLPHMEVERALGNSGHKAHIQLKVVRRQSAERQEPAVLEPRWLFVHKESADTAEKVRALLEEWRVKGLPKNEGQAA